MALSPYPKYKDSKVKWLGTVPDHWEITRNKSYLKYRKETVGDQSDKYTLLSLTLKGIIKRDMENPQGKFPAEFNTYKIVKPGDLIFCLFDIDETPRTVGLSKFDGMITGAYDILYSNNQTVIDYLYLYYLSIDNVKGLRPLYSGLRKVVPKDVFMGMKIALPPTEEQKLIYRYIININSKIQKYISAKRKLIKLLEEQKQAIIHQAVTGAFDVKINKPYEGYNATNIPWIAKIPKHWNSRRLRTVSTMLVSNVDKHTLENEQPVRLCNYVDVYKNERIVEDLDFMKASATQDEINIFKLKINDVLVTKDSEIWTDIGVPSLVCHEANDLLCGYHLAIIRPKNEIHGEYLLRLLQDKFIATQMHVSANGVTRYGLSHGDIKNVTIPIPSIDEQIAIADFLNEYIKKTSLTIRKYSKEIELIQEYRTSIIANVVTGKVDVRYAARTLPDELEAVDELDNSDEEIVEDDSEINDSNLNEVE